MSEQELEKHYLNEHGRVVFKHKTNRDHFLDRSYHWQDRVIMLYEHTVDTYESRTVLDTFKFSTYDLSAWTPMTKEEYDSVKGSYREIYN